MKRFLLLLFCLESTLAANHTFSILTWNVLGREAAKRSTLSPVNANDRFLTSSNYYQPSSSRVQIPTVLKVIQDFDADIICLQEVSHDLIQKIINPILSKKNYARAVQAPKGRDGGVCIYFKKDKFAEKSGTLRIFSFDLPISQRSTQSTPTNPPTTAQLLPNENSNDRIDSLIFKSDTTPSPDHSHSTTSALIKTSSSDDSLDNSDFNTAASSTPQNISSSAATTPSTPQNTPKLAISSTNPPNTPSSSTQTLNQPAGACAGIFLKSKEDGSELFVCSMHLVRPGPSDSDKQAEYLKNQLQNPELLNVLKKCSCPVILAGDFNVRIEVIEKALPLLKNNRPDDFYVYGITPPSVNDYSKPDFVLYRNALKDANKSCSGANFCVSTSNNKITHQCVTGVHQCNNLNGELCKSFPSDHTPLFMTVQIQNDHNINAIEGYLKTDSKKLKRFLTQNDKKILEIKEKIRDLCSELNDLYENEFININELNENNLADYMKALVNIRSNSEFSSFTLAF